MRTLDSGLGSVSGSAFQNEGDNRTWEIIHRRKQVRAAPIRKGDRAGLPAVFWVPAGSNSERLLHTSRTGKVQAAGAMESKEERP